MNISLQHPKRRPAAQTTIRQAQIVRFLLIATILLLLAACQNQGAFGPSYPTRTPGGEVQGQPVLVSFTELNANPEAYQGQMIRVTGDFNRLERESCARFHGPQPRWALIADDLRLDVIGFEDVVRYVPPSTSLTIDGFWQLYRGPAGCGKKPSQDSVWYLNVLQVVQPNPLPLVSLPGRGAGGAITLLDTPTPLPDDSPEPAGTPPASPTGGTPTIQVTASATPSPTSGTGTVTPSGSGTPSQTPSPSATPVQTDGTATATPTATPTATEGSGTTTTPPAPLPTPVATGDYPGPTAYP